MESEKPKYNLGDRVIVNLDSDLAFRLGVDTISGEITEQLGVLDVGGFSEHFYRVGMAQFAAQSCIQPA